MCVNHGIEPQECSLGVTAVISVLGVAVVLCHLQWCCGSVPLVASVVRVWDLPGSSRPNVTQVRMKALSGI